MGILFIIRYIIIAVLIAWLVAYVFDIADKKISSNGDD